MNKNDTVELSITDLTTDGEGVGRSGGCALFVRGAVPGDVINASVMKMKKTYGYARLTQVLTPSPDRVKPPCALAGKCGGCQLQSLSYAAQLRFKQELVTRNLARIGGLPAYREGVDAVPESADGHPPIAVKPVLGMKDPWRARAKTQLPVGYDREGKLCVGFYAPHSHRVVPHTECLLASEKMNAAAREVLAWMEEYGLTAYDEETGKGLIRHLLLREGKGTGEWLACLVINGRKLPHAEALSERLEKLSGFTGVSVNINTERTNVILGRETITVSGKGTLTETIGDLRFEISPASFFQVNPAQTEVLYGEALRLAGLTGKETVWDLYCGTGSISLFLARQAKRVYGVEIVPDAVENAKENARRNGLNNAEFFCGKAEEVVPAWYEKECAEGRLTPGERAADVMVVDPPRKGCDEKLLSCMLAMAPARIVYVSCDSATLARDLKILTAGGYRVTSVQPVDMFPMTTGVENVCLLVRKNG